MKEQHRLKCTVKNSQLWSLKKYPRIVMIIAIISLISMSLSPLTVCAQDGEIAQMKIGIIGDIALTPEQCENAKTDDGYDFSYLFEQMTPYFSSVDCVAGFLETTFSDSEKITRENVAPDSLAAAMKEAGIDVVATATKNCYSGGDRGLLHTLDVLDENEIDHVGTYRTKREKNYIINEYNGLKVAFFSYTHAIEDSIAPSSDANISFLDEPIRGYHEIFLQEMEEDVSLSQNPNAWERLALPSKKNLDNVAQEISSVREEVDYIIVFSSFYENYGYEDLQKTWSDTMVRAGADFIVFNTGSTAPVEYKIVKASEEDYQRSIIFNSVGNATLSVDSDLEEGVMFIITVVKYAEEGYFKGPQFVPLHIDKGKMTPVYPVLTYGNPSIAMRTQLKEIDEYLVDLYIGDHQKKPAALQSIYTILSNIGNSDNANDISLYNLKLALGVMSILVITLAGIPMIIQLIRFIKKINRHRNA